jgi:hypothetical protein
MDLIADFDDEQLWQCPTCGRQLRLVWQGSELVERQRLELGDTSVVHVGGTGGLSIDGAAVQVTP